MRSTASPYHRTVRKLAQPPQHCTDRAWHDRHRRSTPNARARSRSASSPKHRTVRCSPPARLREEQEARNAAEVMYFVAEQLSVDPGLRLTVDLVRRLHELTTAGIEYPHNTPGHFRQHAVTAGDFVPPRTGDEVESTDGGVRRVAEQTTGQRNWPPVVRAVVAHFYFVSIHPFGDGNGRTARAIESFLLYQSRMNPLGFYSLANFYYRDRDEYIRMLDFTRFESGNDLAPFVKYCLGGLVQELEMVFDQVITEAKYTAFREVSREVIRGRPFHARFIEGPAGTVSSPSLVATKCSSQVSARKVTRWDPSTNDVSGERRCGISDTCRSHRAARPATATRSAHAWRSRLDPTSRPFAGCCRLPAKPTPQAEAVQWND